VYLYPAGNSDRPPIRYNPPFTTGVRGLCHDSQPRCLPARANRSGGGVSHALLVVAIGARRRSTATTHARDATTQTLHGARTLFHAGEFLADDAADGDVRHAVEDGHLFEVNGGAANVFAFALDGFSEVGLEEVRDRSVPSLGDEPGLKVNLLDDVLVTHAHLKGLKSTWERRSVGASERGERSSGRESAHLFDQSELTFAATIF